MQKGVKDAFCSNSPTSEPKSKTLEKNSIPILLRVETFVLMQYRN